MGFFKPHTDSDVIVMFQVEERAPVEFEAGADACSLVVGMPGIGRVGRNAVLVLVEKLALEPVYEMFSDEFPAQALVTDAGRIRVPRAQLFLASLSCLPTPVPDPRVDHLLLLTGDAQPANSRGIYRFTREVVTLVRGLTEHVTSVIGTGALVPDQVPAKAAVHASGTHDALLDALCALPGHPCERMTGGAITGANGILPAWMGTFHDVPGACLLADTLPVVDVDPRASCAILNVLSEYFGLSLTFPALTEKAEALEARVDTLRKKNGRPPENRASNMYYG